MAELYEAATLAFPLMATAEVAAGARAWMAAADARGTPLGCWRAELGTLGRLFVLRRFADTAELAAERRRTLLSPAPFGGGAIAALSTEGYAAFPFLPPVTVPPTGKVFEFRAYRLKPGGLPQTLAGWEAAIGPAAEYTAHLVTNLYALDGPARILHIWAFDTLEQRAELRARHYAAGTWPPKGGPDAIAEASATIALPV